MCRVDQRAQFFVSAQGVIRKTRLRTDEVVDAVTVVSVRVERKVLESRTEPDSSGAEALDIGELLLNPGKRPALKAEEIGIIKGPISWTRGRVVEPVEHQEINPAIAPVRRGRKWRR